MANLKEKSTAPLRAILEMVFDKTPNWWDSQETQDRHEKIRDDAIFKSKLASYTDRVAEEEDRYLPFCELANHIISLLCLGIKDAPLVIVRNNRVMVLGSAVIWFPDCVAVNPIVLNDPRRGSAEKLAKEGPKDLPFAWQEILTFIEFKMQQKHLGKSLEDELNKFAGSGSQDDQGIPSGSRWGDLISAAPIISTEVKQSHKSSQHAESTSLSFTDWGNIIGAKPTKQQPGDSPISPQEQRKRPKTGAQTQTEQASQVPLGPNPSGKLFSEVEDFEGTNNEAFEEQDDGDSDYLPGGIVKKTKQDKQKLKEPQTRVSYALHCASYALELLSHTSPSTHRVGFLVNDDKIQMQYYDRSRVVVSPEVSFIKNRAVLVDILDCLTSATPRQWGFLDGIQLPQDVPRSYTPNMAKISYLASSTFVCKNNAVLKLGNIIFRQHAIIGRGTCGVAHAQSDYSEWKEQLLVVNITFTPATRPSESKYLDEIHKHAHEDKNKDILDHFPEMLLFQEFPSTATATQDRFRKYFEMSGENVSYEMRNVQLLVVTQLKPVKNLNQGQDVKEVLTGIVKGYIWLYKKAKLLHRDISVENIMYRYKNGKICGVLNDFDLAIFTSEQANSPLSKQRTGTRPYMALELLGSGVAPCRHLYRHDLESIMYVTMVLACFRLASVEDQRESEIMSWFDPKATERDIRKSKREFLTGDYGPPVATSTMTSLSQIVKDLYVLFRKMTFARSLGSENTTPPDPETLNGAMTLEKFGKIFDL